MEYYLHYDENGNIVGSSNIYIESDEFSCVQVSDEDYDAYIANNNYKQQRVAEIQTRLNELSQDFLQVFAGAVIEDIDDRKAEFEALHNELRQLLGKEPRTYNN